jgi:phosphoglycerate dehydrogenase-like enzyme
MSRPRVRYLPPPSHTALVFRPEVYARLCDCFDLVATEGEARLTTEELEQGIDQYDAVVTGWGSPRFSAAALERAERLRLVAHSAGSVKFLFTPELVRDYLIPRGIAVTSANLAIAYNVAEATIGYLIAFSRGWFEQVQYIRETEGWANPAVPKSGQFLRGATVGIVSASTVGREVIRLLRGFDVRILVYDPGLFGPGVKNPGFELRSLDDLFAEADFVSLHAPSIPATRHMIGRDQLRRLRDGALLVNTSRGSVLDHDALLEEARTGRIKVVLDVTEPEPLPGDHPLCRLPNVYITPHVSGAGRDGYLRIGNLTAAALYECFDGRPIASAVDLSRWDELA